MSRVTVDRATGALRIGGAKAFPLGLSNPPPLGSKAPNGVEGPAGGEVLFEYTQEPPPPPIGAGRQVFRSIAAGGGGFRDWLGPHDPRVYRFSL